MSDSFSNTNEQIDKMKQLAECDYLTGLANRRGLYEYYSGLDKNQSIHAVFIDIDNFKRVNDIYGHSMGDELLLGISRLIQKHSKGFSSRIGGDEYVLLIDGAFTKEEIVEMAETMLREMQNMEFRKDILSLVSLSIGIVLEQSLNQCLDDILYKCDAAMYQAKYGGKNCYALYKAYDKTIEINKNMELEMENALKTGQMILYLQPKINMVTSKICGAEGLSRWMHPLDGLRLPELYIPLFEKNGFISRLDLYIYEEVCKVKAAWKGTKYEHIPVSVNMSRLHLYNREFPDMLADIANRYGVAIEELEIEITESVFIKDCKELIEMVKLLKKRGFLVSIDHFGSGFSPLKILQDIPVDTIKIDREFLTLSCAGTKGKKIIRNVIALCRDLKFDVICEGIESKEQVDFITSCGCQTAQGFYYAQPLGVDKFEQFADEYLKNTLNNYTFHFNGDLKSEDGSMEGMIVGEGLSYVPGIMHDTKAIHFPGGPVQKNTVNLPPNTIVNDSFTVAVWIKPDVLRKWVSVLYIKFESGFGSIVPMAVDGESDFRIRDSKEVNGWYDITGCQLQEDIWTHVTISYNAKTEKAILCINGEVAGMMENVPTNRFVKWIIVGGDVFQPSFEGSICELVIYNEAKDYNFIKELFLSYVNNEKFNAFG